LGLDVQETLDIAQSLYETHKATTYRYADDFIITGATKEVLENDAHPITLLQRTPLTIFDLP
jgi:DNA topoisomerase IA